MRCTVDFTGIEESNPKNWKNANPGNNQLKRVYIDNPARPRVKFEGLKVGAKGRGTAVVTLKKGISCSYTILKGGGTVIIESNSTAYRCPK